MPATIQALADLVEGQVHGAADLLIQEVAPLQKAQPDQLTYLEDPKKVAKLRTCQAGAILVTPAVVEAARGATAATLIAVAEPQAAFIQVMLHFRPLRSRPALGIDQRAVISPTAKIGTGTNVWPGATIADGVVIGKNCDIHPGVVIGPGCRLGDECVLHPNAVLYHDVTLGQRVIIHANAVIGADGFGYRMVRGQFVRIPHTGTVIVEDDVEIGACATVDRAMVGATVIGMGTKIDNLVMIAHNCEIGRHNAFASQVGFAGSCKTGDYVRCGGQVGVADHITIGSQAALGGKSGVMGDIPEKATYYGVPAAPDMEQIRIHLALRKLPDLRDQVKELEKTVKALQKQLQPASAAPPAAPAVEAA
ncbi:UDP-3-O-(3-hydroxymyristoyl)glucosamine N-acyltransferase [Planctomyces sp. SH-PL14]|uniref:UDP-3-O-(3-hydroxymyristoyl)glucosamine N-acyltransferase n=1 Tax=Planctomyces sp. SH-PL14 TaxID=1632864 RepID=UPI00078BB211|nr:UDP-3-O-(3-hydroxymyristoyl)glucosamine N-acyltransferase [Planctomyces sp. SH-PL14]AMV17217.1 UDP-3-O-acylglucosamine N-acyltransferase [Planctomyces sp. SH-PL14]